MHLPTSEWQSPKGSALRLLAAPGSLTFASLAQLLVVLQPVCAAPACPACPPCVFRPSATLLLFSALQGCGIVEFETHEAAQEAMRQLDGRYVWPPAHRPLLVTPVRTPQVIIHGVVRRGSLSEQLQVCNSRWLGSPQVLGGLGLAQLHVCGCALHRVLRCFLMITIIMIAACPPMVLAHNFKGERYGRAGTAMPQQCALVAGALTLLLC
jgi:hypothetical protein